MNAKELVQMFNDGKLRQLFERCFNSRLTEPFPNRDSEFVAIFEKKLPQREDLQEIVSAYYRKEGCVVQVGPVNNSDTLSLNISIEGVDGLVATVTITWRYPHNQTIKNIGVKSVIVN